MLLTQNEPPEHLHQPRTRRPCTSNPNGPAPNTPGTPRVPHRRKLRSSSKSGALVFFSPHEPEEEPKASLPVPTVLLFFHPF